MSRGYQLAINTDTDQFKDKNKMDFKPLCVVEFTFPLRHG